MSEQAKVTTKPFDVQAFIQAEDEQAPGFAAAVDREVDVLRREAEMRAFLDPLDVDPPKS